MVIATALVFSWHLIGEGPCEHALALVARRGETIPPKTKASHVHDRPLFTNVQTLSRAVELGLDADGTFVAINNRISQSVPHLHVHVVPRRRGDGLRGFFWPRQTYRDDDHIREVQEAIREAIGRVKAAN